MTKLTIIGAGSAVFTKNIFTDLMFIDDFKKMDIALVDIDEKRLKISHELLDVISKKLNASKTDMSKISDMDFVLYFISFVFLLYLLPLQISHVIYTSGKKFISIFIIPSP